MKNIRNTLLLLILTVSAWAQVGIGNIDPKSSLDISVSDPLAPSNTDGILIPRADEFPLINPTVDQDGMMLFITGNGAATRGFYFWDNGGALWTTVNGGSSDADWFESGTSSAPDAITDNIYTQGNIGVGTNTTTSDRVYVNNDITQNFSGLRVASLGTDPGTIGYGIYNQSSVGDVLRFTNFYNAVAGTTNSTLNGIENKFNNNGTGTKTGVSNDFDFSAPGGGKIGVENRFEGGDSFATGVKNTAPSAWTITGNLIGVDNNLSAGGNGQRYGTLNSINGTGTGAKYGTYTSISSTAGGTHYGIYSDVRKTTGYAGFFIGRASFGVDPISNRYLLPAADGTAGQMITTNGTGQLSFATPPVGTEIINDLTDGKSDIDGTNNGSSIFLGIGAGAADDSSNNANVGIGYQALQQTTNGYGNVGVGNSSLSNNTTGYSNLGLGWVALQANTIGYRNIGIGEATLLINTTGDENIAIGNSSLQNNVTGNSNTAIGTQAGFFNTGSANVFLGYYAGFNETGSNKLYIENSNANATNALIYGEFDNDILRTNGEFQIGDPTGTGYAFPAVDGTFGQAMFTNGAGNVTFQNIPGDGTGTDDQNLLTPSISGTILNLGIEGGTGTSIDLAPLQDGTGTDDQTVNLFSLSGDTLGISLEDDGQPVQTVDLSGLSFNVTNFALAKMTMSSAQSLAGGSFTKLNFDTAAFDLGSNFNATTDRFEATETGYYRITASFRSVANNTTSNIFQIYVAVNGLVVKRDERSHHGSGPVSRYVDTIQYIAAGGHIEMWSFVQSALSINSSTQYTTFEVERIR